MPPITLAVLILTLTGLWLNSPWAWATPPGTLKTPPDELATSAIDPDNPVRQRPIIALVLGGGGAKGAAHVGVLKVLEQQRIPIDIVVGTSAGSAVGAMYALGKSAADIQTTFFDTDWEKGFIDSTPRPDLSVRRKQDQRQFAIDIDLGYGEGRFRIPQGIVQGQRLQILLNEMLMEGATVEDFDRLPHIYRAVATDLETGEEVVLGSGNLALAVRASMSVPGVYTPVEIQGQTLVDGGLANNVPISVARTLGADVIIAVDLSTPLRRSEQIQDSLDVLSQLSDFMTGLNSATQVSSLGPQDILIQPAFGEYGSASFDHVREIITIGEQSAQAQTDRLTTLAVSEAEYAAYQQRREAFLREAPRLDRVQLVNRSVIDDGILLAQIRQQPGTRLDPVALEEDLGRIYGLGYFEIVTYRIQTEADHTRTLVIEAREKSWGPTYIRFGIDLEDNFRGDSEYALSSSVLVTGLNPLGAEWVTTVEVGTSPSVYTEFYQPLGYSADYFSQTSIIIERYSSGVFAEGDQLATFEIDQHLLATELGRHFGTYADAALGLESGAGTVSVNVGPPLPARDFDSGGAYFRVYYDRLDDQFFPRDGQYGILRYGLSRESLGADADFDRVELGALTAHAYGHLHLNLGVQGSFVTRNQVQAQDSANLGGFLQLSGYARNELSGQDSLLMVARAYHRMSDSTRWYLGGSFEAGNVYDQGDSIALSELELAGSLYIAANTFAGPITLAYGWADSDSQSIYLNFGSLF